MFPPGRARLDTKPGPPKPMTMGIVLVASLAASMAVAVTATITSTGIRTSSRASPGSRSVLPSAYRRSTTRFCPST